jgi:hypothetical protein
MKSTKTCSIDGCRKKIAARGWCQTHYTRWWKYGSPDALKTRPRGEGHLRKDGYITLQRDGRKALAHRVAMETYLGRPLLSVESVHHRDGNRQNNRISNLELWSSTHPAGQRVEDQVRWARDIVDRYGDLF